MVKLANRLSIIIAMFLASHCAAKLPREVTSNRPKGVEARINLDEVNLVRLQDGEVVNVGSYMKEQGLEWLVLNFGSKSCGVCMEKARYFQANLVGTGYGLLGENVKGRIEMIGVATDPEASRDELLALVEDDGLYHLAWSDPAPVNNKMMMKYFQPAGMDFSVPLTVMLSREGLLWRISSKEKLSPAEIIEKIAATIGSSPGPLPLPSEGGDDGDDGATRPLLAKEIASRLDGVAVKSCLDRRDVNLGSELPASPELLRAVLVYKGKCSDSEDCLEARGRLRSWQGRCALRYGASCDYRELAIDDASECDSEQILIGGQDFFDVFADHFSWSYMPGQVSPGRIRLPEVKGPLTLVFDSLGRTVFSQEGSLGDSLQIEMALNLLRYRAPGPQFGLRFDDSPVGVKNNPLNVTFDQIRASTKYTMVMFWNTDCSSCTDEIEEWHQESDSAYQFCRSHGNFCRVVALETRRAESGQSPENYLSSLVHGNDDFVGWITKGWTMPLAVELEPSSDGRAPMGWYSGWIRAKFGSSEPRTVLYDIEGKVVGTWQSLPGEHGPRDELKKLYEAEGPWENNK